MYDDFLTKPDDAARFGLKLALRLAVTLGDSEMVGPCHDGERMNYPITGGRFAGRGIAGEVTWVGLYVSLGYAFTGNIAAASSRALELLGFFAAGAVALGLAAWLTVTVRAERARARQAH